MPGAPSKPFRTWPRLVDHPKPLGVFLVKPEQEVQEMDVYRPAKSEGVLSEGLLSLDFCLRDRDHARATMGQPGQRSALCVGDKAREWLVFRVNGTDLR